MHQVASQHYAFEGRCFVLLAASFLTKAMMPAHYEFQEEMESAPGILLSGGSAVLGPDGRYVVEPLFEAEKLLAAEIDTERVYEEKLTLDVAGHYSRPDLFELKVDRRELGQVQVRE
jgi:predicted amidohydrolase